ncbi:MAG TPA: hypothetical protein PKM88_08050 [bacterium]|nr:hypothetical protein [bacterium]
MTGQKKREPPPETGTRGNPRALAGRIAALVAVLLAIYGIVWFFHEEVFAPQLRITGVLAADTPLAGDSPVQVGLQVANDRWADGAAYVVLVIDGETEVEGPVTAVRARETAAVMLTARLPPGWRSGTLLLFDAWRDNVRVDARHGVPIRVGTTEFAIVAAEYPITVNQGETLPLTVLAANRGGVGARVVPIVVALTETGAQVAETDGRSCDFSAQDTQTLALTLATHRLTPGDYFLAILLTEPATGKRTGQGLYRRPLRVSPAKGGTRQ